MNLIYDSYKHHENLRCSNFPLYPEAEPRGILSIKNFGDTYQESSKKLPVRCEQVVSIEDDSGNPIEYDCYSNEMKPMISDNAKSNNGATRLGGILIMAGSGLLYVNLEKDCSECDLEELQSFSDDSLARQKIAFLLLGFGGFLIAMGG